MDIRQLEVFVQIANAGSFSSAAAQLYLTHSALLQQTKRLERELGFDLFTRSHQGLELTEAGRQFYTDSLRLITDANEAVANARRIANAPREALRIAYTPGIPYHTCTDVLPLFREERPACTVEFVSSKRMDWVVDTLRGTIDVFECPDCPWVSGSGLVFQPLYADPLGCLVGPSDPLANRPCIRPADLAGRRLLFQDAQLCSRYLSYIADTGTPIDTANMDADIANVLQACLNGALYLMPRSIAPLYEPLLFVPVEDRSSYTVGIAFRENPSPAVRRFAELAVTHFGPQNHQHDR